MSNVFQECFNKVLFRNFVACISSQLPKQRVHLFLRKFQGHFMEIQIEDCFKDISKEFHVFLSLFLTFCLKKVVCHYTFVWTQNLFRPKLSFFDPKFLLPKILLYGKNFYPPIFMDPISFFLTRFFWTKNLLGPVFFNTNFFWHKTSVKKKIVHQKNFFGPGIFIAQKFFGAHNFVLDQLN